MPQCGIKRGQPAYMYTGWYSSVELITGYKQRRLLPSVNRLNRSFLFRFGGEAFLSHPVLFAKR